MNHPFIIGTLLQIFHEITMQVMMMQQPNLTTCSATRDRKCWIFCNTVDSRLSVRPRLTDNPMYGKIAKNRRKPISIGKNPPNQSDG